MEGYPEDVSERPDERAEQLDEPTSRPLGRESQERNPHQGEIDEENEPLENRFPNEEDSRHEESG